MRRFNTLIVFTVVLVFLGCNSLLEQNPKGELTEQTLFETPDDAYKALVSIYRVLHYEHQSPAGHIHCWAFGDVASDDAMKGGESGSDAPEILQIQNFNITATNPELNAAWKTAYRGIHRANLVIKNAPNVEGLNQATATRYVNESKFLRAYWYYDLVRKFGGVPLVLKPSLDSYEIPKNSREEIFQQIESDLEAAAGALPTKSSIPQSELGRATKGAAQALACRAHLFQGDFAKAEDWCGRVIDSGEYSLDPDYSHIFSVDGEHGPGTIFSISYGNNAAYWNDGNVDNIMRGSRGMYGWGFDTPTQDLVNAFEQDDPRKDATVFSNGEILVDGDTADVGNSPTGYICEKYYVPDDVFPANYWDTPKDKIRYRLGMVLLWYAEAANENGHTQEALQALNRVRDRAREGNSSILTDITTTNKQSLREAIWQEQRVEYAMEQKRFYDLVRTDRAAKILHDFAEEYNTQKGANFTESKNELMPIPQAQIDLSQGNLKQNPGY